MASKSTKINVSKLLSDDNVMISGYMHWSKLFEKFSSKDKNSEDEGLPAAEAFEKYRLTEDDQDEDESSASDVEDCGDVDSESSVDCKDVRKQLAVVVRDREHKWKKNGLEKILNDVHFELSTNFVESWLKENVAGSSKQFERCREARIIECDRDSTMELTCKSSVSFVNDVQQQQLSSVNSSNYEFSHNTNRKVVVQQMEKTTVTKFSNISEDGSTNRTLCFASVPNFDFNSTNSLPQFLGFKIPLPLSQLYVSKQPNVPKITNAYSSIEPNGNDYVFHEKNTLLNDDKRNRTGKAAVTTYHKSKWPAELDALESKHQTNDKVKPPVKKGSRSENRDHSVGHRKKSYKKLLGKQWHSSSVEENKSPEETEDRRERFLRSSNKSKARYAESRQNSRKHCFESSGARECVPRSQVSYNKTSKNTKNDVAKESRRKPNDKVVSASTSSDEYNFKGLIQPEAKRGAENYSASTSSRYAKSTNSNRKDCFEGSEARECGRPSQVSHSKTSKYTKNEVAKELRKNQKDGVVYVSTSSDESTTKALTKPDAIRGAASTSSSEPSATTKKQVAPVMDSATASQPKEEAASQSEQYIMPKMHQEYLSEGGRCRYHVQGIVIYRPNPTQLAQPRSAEKIQITRQDLDLSAVTSDAKLKKFENFKQQILPNSTLVYYMSETEGESDQASAFSDEDDDPISQIRPKLVVYEFKHS